jgi:GNAT superfamily N-acetyltransferase
VQNVADETYGGQWAQPPLPIDEEDWSLAWVAAANSEIVGVVLTAEDWVSDLWVLRSFRGSGVGTALLGHAEAEIADRGYRHAKLRVVRSNTNAAMFYQKRGWQVDGVIPHEHLPITMVVMTKPLDLETGARTGRE